MFLKSNEGSISILIMGLFIVSLSFVVVMTDISVVYLAKRNLTSLSESASQRGLSNIDDSNYYQGEFNLLQEASTVMGNGESDPGIPIDCNKGENDVEESLRTFSLAELGITRVNLHGISLEKFECDGFAIYIETSAMVDVPIQLPFMNSRTVRIHSYSGGLPERAFTNNFSGLDNG
jgi:hypothetical protein